MAHPYSSGHWRPKPGEEDAFVEAWTEFARWIVSMDGAGAPHLLRDKADAGRYMSFARWRDAESMDAWRNHAEFPERLGRVREHVDEFAPSDFELVAEVEAGAAQPT
jgi:heme-degrading monooxygenase HmoA